MTFAHAMERRLVERFAATPADQDNVHSIHVVLRSFTDGRRVNRITVLTHWLCLLLFIRLGVLRTASK